MSDSGKPVMVSSYPNFHTPADAMEAAITAFNEATGLNLVWTIENVPTDEPSVLGRVIGTNPPAGSLVEPEQLIVVFVGVPDLDG